MVYSLFGRKDFFFFLQKLSSFYLATVSMKGQLFFSSQNQNLFTEFFAINMEAYEDVTENNLKSSN